MTTSQGKPWTPDWVVHPGEILREALEERGWPQTQLAAATGFSSKHVNFVLQGRAGIGVDFALALEDALGTTAEFWMNLQVAYDLGVARASG